MEDGYGLWSYCPACGWCKCPHCKNEGRNIFSEEDVEIGRQPWCLKCGWRPVEKSLGEDINSRKRESLRKRRKRPTHAGLRL